MTNLKEILSEEKFKDYEFVVARIKDLQKTRENGFGENLEKIWEEADKAYIPHRLKQKGKRVIATDEERGWRGALVELGKTGDWQADFSQPNPFIKMQTAAAILIDRNPKAILNPGAQKFEKNTLLMKNLYERNWDYAKSIQQLKLFVHNLMKYGWSCARTYPKIVKRDVKVLETYNQDDPENSVYTKKEVTEYNDVYRENLDPYNVWIDDMAKPNQADSIRDWCFRKVYARDVLEQELGKYKRYNLTKDKTGIISPRIIQSEKDKRYQEKDLVEVYFYENKIKDLLMVNVGGIDGIPVVIEPLPVADSEGRKRLSLWQTYWLLRNTETIYGIGMYEAMRDNQRALDRIRNMRLDQVLLSIYKFFLFSGTSALTETGKVVIEPGVGKQVLDPKSVQWMEVPGPGAESYKELELYKKDLDDAAGVPPILEGTISGKTAFEVAQAKEAALKRLRTPLDNISDALEEDGYISVYLFQTLYSIPEIYKIQDKDKIEGYLNEIKGDTELYNRTETDEFQARVYREVQLGLTTDEKGNLIESKDTRFFRIKPSGLKWEGIINIKGQSVLSISKELEKAQNLELVSVLNPLIHDDPAIVGKLTRNILKEYDKDPEDWLPDSWLQEPSEQPLIMPQGGMVGQLQGQRPAQPQTSQQTGRLPLMRGTPPNVIQRFMTKLRRTVPFMGSR